jgi:hypothetical protein
MDEERGATLLMEAEERRGPVRQRLAVTTIADERG